MLPTNSLPNVAKRVELQYLIYKKNMTSISALPHHCQVVSHKGNCMDAIRFDKKWICSILINNFTFLKKNILAFTIPFGILIMVTAYTCEDETKWMKSLFA